MTRSTRVLLNLFKPLYEGGILLEKIPQNLPANLKGWTAASLAAGTMATSAVAAAQWWVFGYVMWEQIAILAQMELLGSGLFSVLYATPGLLRAAHQAALESNEWKQARLEGRSSPLQLPGDR